MRSMKHGPIRLIGSLVVFLIEEIVAAVHRTRQKRRARKKSKAKKRAK